MVKNKKKYVAYKADTFEFIGFYSEGRPDMPSTVAEVDISTFLSDKGQHTHYAPKVGFYTPEGTAYAALSTANRAWRDAELLRTDKVMLVDWPISEINKQTVIKYRKDLRSYPETWDRPKMGVLV